MEQLDLKEIRLKLNITQLEAAKFLQVSLSSYKSYENEDDKKRTIKYNYLCNELEKYNFIDEENGVLTIDEIKVRVQEVLSKYDVNFCYLFGSYAKNKANGKSDIDLLIDTEVTGLDFYGLVEELRVTLKKRIDLLKVNQLTDNQELLINVLKYGIKIYG